MATFRKAVQIVRPDAYAFPDLLSNQLTLTNPAIGNIICYVMTETGTDTSGVYIQ